MTEFRSKFENHLILRRHSPKTSTAYINAVKSLAGYPAITWSADRWPGSRLPAVPA